jgi:aryl-alcohol dehydrogenase-like predicted oxidoreductase
MMSYGDKNWPIGPWTLGEEEGIEHVKAAFAAGINTFDTANVSSAVPASLEGRETDSYNDHQVYSNGRSEEILGKAIKVLQLPRDEIVIMTKACFHLDRKSPLLNK